jgi:hypothetical protein
MSEGLILQRVSVTDVYASPAARAELDAEISELSLFEYVSTHHSTREEL